MNKLEIACEMIKQMEVTQSQLANDIGVSRSNLSRMLKGSVSIDKHFPTINSLFQDWKYKKVHQLKNQIDILNQIQKKADKCLKS